MEDRAKNLEILTNILHATCGVDPALVIESSRLIEDLNVDSLGMLEAVIEFEDAFGVTVDASLIPPKPKVSDLLDIIHR